LITCTVAIEVGGPRATEDANSNLLTIDNYSYLTATYSDENITYYAHVLQDNWLAIGYGTSMMGTDVVIWAAGSDVDTSAQYDSYSTTYALPGEDDVNIYTTTMVVNGDYIDFTSVRPLESD
jgi:hypothetical protein